MNNFREFWIYLKKLLKLGEYSSREIKKEEKRLLKIKQEEAKERGRLQVIESEKKKAAKIEEDKQLALQKEADEEKNELLKEQKKLKEEEEARVFKEKARLEAKRIETEKSIRLKAEEMQERERKRKVKIEKEKTLALEKELEERQKAKPKLPILIVEDSVINQKIMNMIITKMGFETVLAENGQVAVDLAKKQEFSLILMDIEMPIKDGIEASKEIFAIDSIKRQEKRLIIALTSNDTDSHIEEYLAIGMRECISKPVNAEGIKTLFGKYKLL